MFKCFFFALKADASDMGLEEVLTSIKKVPKSSRKRQNSQSGGRKSGPRMNDGMKDDQLDMMHMNWFDEKLNGDDDPRHFGGRKSAEKPKSRKKSDSKVDKVASDRKPSRRSRSDSENVMQLGFALDELKDIHANGGVGGRPELAADSKRRREGRGSYEQVWNQDLFAGWPDLQMDPMLSPGGGFGARFAQDQGTSGDARKSVGAELDKLVGEEKTGRTRHKRQSSVKTDAVTLSPDTQKPETLMTNMAMDMGNSNIPANFPNHKVCSCCHHLMLCFAYAVC